tara:strand:- start:107 stop:730 length:624 start_codon:yes stop_codon:yes gene_type:complete
MLEVKSIKNYECKDWLLNKHYAKRMCSISYAFGLYIDNILNGVCTFGKPASNSLCVGVCGKNNSRYVYELNRLITNDNLIKNSLSFFVSQCLKTLPPLIIVSYADTLYNHNGYIYQATNWIYTGKTKERTDIGTTNNYHSRHYNKNIDYKKNRKFRSSKHRYIYFTGSKTQNKIWLKNLNYNIEKYPKGNNKNYDASYKPKVQTRLF